LSRRTRRKSPIFRSRGDRAGYVWGTRHYNNVRLNSATGYITPKDVLAERQQETHAERDRKLEAPDSNATVAASKPGEERSGQPPRCRTAGEVDTAHTCLIESGNPLTGRSPDVWYQPVTHLLEIFLVALQIACQQLLLANDAHNEQPDHGEA